LIAVVPSRQLGARHCFVEGVYPQAVRSTPLHVPPQMASPPHAGRLVPLAACGASRFGTGEHVPALFVTSHASHCPLHAWSQHTPSTQYPLVHCLAPSGHSAALSSFALQSPPEQ
jgi:hypothetical protein